MKKFRIDYKVTGYAYIDAESELQALERLEEEIHQQLGYVEIKMEDIKEIEYEI